MERDVFQQTFERLKTQSGLTDAEIARRLDVNRSTVSRWKDGTISPPLSKIKEIANLFGVSPLEFIDDSVEENEVRNTLKKLYQKGQFRSKENPLLFRFTDLLRLVYLLKQYRRRIHRNP